MKKRIAVLVSTLALVALAGMAQAATTRFAVQDATPADVMVIQDNGYIGIGSSTPVGPIHVKSSGSTYASAGMRLEHTALTATPKYFWSPNFSFYRNNDVSAGNGGLPRSGDSLGALNYGSVTAPGSYPVLAVLDVRAERAWTATDTPTTFIMTVNPGGASVKNRDALTIASTGTVTVNGGVRLYPYTGTSNNAALVPTKPACDATTQGTLWFTKTAGADTLQICADGATNGGGIQWRTIAIP